MWEPQASASGRVYQLTEASVLIASLHSHPPVQLYKGTTGLVMQIPYLRAHVSVFSIAKKKKKILFAMTQTLSSSLRSLM